MYLLLITVGIFTSCVLFALWIKRRRENRDLESHSITTDALQTLMNAHREVLVFDVRRPLDLLTDLEIIPGSTRVPPEDFLRDPSLIPKDKDAVVYCTCPGDETARRVVHKGLSMGFSRIKLLKGGLPAWKAKGYAVEAYNKPFHLDTGT